MNKNRSFDNIILSKALEEVDTFLLTLSTTENKSTLPKFPSSVGQLLDHVEKLVSQSNLGWGYEADCEKENSDVLECASQISKLINSVGEFARDSNPTHILNRTTNVMFSVMSFLENEFRGILETIEPIKPAPAPRTLMRKLSFERAHEPEQKPEPERTQNFPGYLPNEISNMNRIVIAMIGAGYEHECCIVYYTVRRNAFNRELENLGFGHLNIEDVQRMPRETLESEIVSWIGIIKHCFSDLLCKEGELCRSVFSEYPSISETLFDELSLGVIIKLLNFTDAIALTSRSAEKLFKFLDVYETLRDLIPIIDKSYSSKCASEMIQETSTAKSRIGEATVSIFRELEYCIKSDSGRIPVPGGAVHPLTRYIMNYLRYACEYKTTLDQVFQQYKRGIQDSRDQETKEGANEDGTSKTSPFAVELNTIMDMLHENLDVKSKLYRDPALRYIFLMNNGRYILQKVKDSAEIFIIMGMNWCRKHSTDLKMYHKSYMRESWTRFLQCLSHEGLQVNGKVSKQLIKERFKMFNTLFEEIHKTQSAWVVHDEQLQSELRVSVSAIMIPAYRSFAGRFRQNLGGSKSMEKYIKYQPEDIENLIEELFAGNPMSMAKRR